MLKEREENGRSRRGTRKGLVVGALFAALGFIAPVEASPELKTTDLIRESALIGMFEVTELDPYAYDSSTETERTRVVLEIKELLYGEWPEGELDFLLPYGIFPDGSETVWTEIPLLAAGEEYLLFIREGEWHVTPIVGNAAYRAHQLNGQTVLVDEEGRAVRNLNDYGFALDHKVAPSSRELASRIRAGETDTPPIDPDRVRSALSRAKSPQELTGALHQHIVDYRSQHRERRESGAVHRAPSPIFVAEETR